MEIGFGFLIGLLGGGGIALVVTVLLAASRKAVKSVGNTVVRPAPSPTTTSARTAPTRVSATRSGAKTSDEEEKGRPGGKTVILSEMEEQSTELNKSIHEVRNMLLSLADIIGSAETASGRAKVAFTNAKDVIHGVDFTDVENSGELAEAQRALIEEVERVLTSNIELSGQLDKANKGIAEQRQQIEELRVQARIDSLTRIPNRAAFDERLAEYVSLLERTNLVFTLMLIDIDHFKRVNDVHGHINGDRILRGVAAKISASVRNNDFAARYGGEEFAVIFPATELAEAKLVAERMRRDISNTNFSMDGQRVKVTISGGLAECCGNIPPAEVVTSADKALYHAKRSGRNQVVTIDEVPVESEA